MHSKYAYGRRRPAPTARAFITLGIMGAALDPLGPPPVDCNPYAANVTVPWNIYGNDVLSNCVPCDTAHTLMLRTACAGSIVVPTQIDVDALYSAVGGWVATNPSTDQGCDESDMETYLRTTGFLGHVATTTGNVDASNLDHIKWCVQLFGSCRLGLNLPGYAEHQFEIGQPWSVITMGDQSTEGHDVPIVDFRDGLLYCVTWGKLQPVTPEFFAKYCEEAHAELFPDWVQAQGTAPSGLDLAGLIAKMESVDA
jgi:hypothetical protein